VEHRPFYGTSYFVDPRGQFLATAREDKDELVMADLDLDVIEEVRRTWQFYRDRRPDSYGDTKTRRAAIAKGIFALGLSRATSRASSSST
jgi:predicted amidohydrolase